MNESPVELFWLPFFCLSICLSINFSHFHFLLQNHWAIFYQTLHKTFWGEGDSIIHKWGTGPIPTGDNSDILYKNISYQHLRIFSRTTGPKIWQKTSLGKGNSSLMRCHTLFQRGDNTCSENTLLTFKKFFFSRSTDLI